MDLPDEVQILSVYKSITVAAGTSSTQISVSDIILQQKDVGLLEADSLIGTGYYTR